VISSISKKYFCVVPQVNPRKRFIQCIYKKLINESIKLKYNWPLNRKKKTYGVTSWVGINRFKTRLFYINSVVYKNIGTWRNKIVLQTLYKMLCAQIGKNHKQKNLDAIHVIKIIAWPISKLKKVIRFSYRQSGRLRVYKVLIKLKLKQNQVKVISTQSTRVACKNKLISRLNKTIYQCYCVWKKIFCRKNFFNWRWQFERRLRALRPYFFRGPRYKKRLVQHTKLARYKSLFLLGHLSLYIIQPIVALFSKPFWRLTLKRIRAKKRERWITTTFYRHNYFGTISVRLGKRPYNSRKFLQLISSFVNLNWSLYYFSKIFSTQIGWKQFLLNCLVVCNPDMSLVKTLYYSELNQNKFKNSLAYTRYITHYGLYFLLTDQPIFYIVYKSELIYNKVYYTNIIYFSQYSTIINLFYQNIGLLAHYSKKMYKNCVLKKLRKSGKKRKKRARLKSYKISKIVSRRFALFVRYRQLIAHIYAHWKPKMTGKKPSYCAGSYKDLVKLTFFIGMSSEKKKLKQWKRWLWGWRVRLNKRRKKIVTLTRRFRRFKTNRRVIQVRLRSRIFHLNILLKRIILELYGFTFTYSYLYRYHHKNSKFVNIRNLVNFIIKKNYKYDWSQLKLAAANK